MKSSELIKIDYSAKFQDDEIVHAKVIKKPFDNHNKSFKAKLKSFEIESENEFLDSKRALPTIDTKKLDFHRYRANYSNKSKVVTKELEKHLVRTVLF
jgi:hypothetical protein